MAKITKVSQQKRSSRVNVYLDNRFGFGLSKKTLVDFDLFVGKEIFPKQIKEILIKDQKIKALEKSLRWLGIRPRSQKELEKKLKNKGFTQAIIKETIKKLQEFDYLNDKKFAQSWLEARKLSGKGKFIVQKELKEKGINEEIIKKILEKYSTDDEFEIARELVNKKIKNYQKGNIFTKKQKIARYLASRGFGWETIIKILKR